MSRVMVILIDAMDSIQLARYESDLPNLRRLKDASPAVKSMSVYPPDSPTALTSIYTGLNPARHGVVHFIDPLEKANTNGQDDFDNTVLKGKTFWDIAGKNGKKVCVVLPYLGYPPWQVNGIMVAKSAVKDGVQIFPESLSEEYNLPLLNTIKGFPGRGTKLDRYLEKQKELASHKLDFAQSMLVRDKWDLFFFYSGIIDSIHHRFWRYCDKNDPSYPGPNPYQDVIKDFYILHDRMVGKLIEAAGSDTAVILLSDHGHGMRPVKLLNINELLRQKGLLIPRAAGPAGRGVLRAVEKAKRTALNFVSRHDMGNAAAKLLRLFPAAKKVYTSPLSIDWSKTVAYVSDLSGVKSYPYGGININRDKLAGRDYEKLRDLIIKEVSEMRNPDNGEKLVNLVCRREDLYSGEYIGKYPDIVLELKDDWGIGWAINDSLFGSSPSHNLVPGSHKLRSPVFFISNTGEKKVAKKDVELIDVAPTVLDLLDINGDFNFDGRSILG